MSAVPVLHWFDNFDEPKGILKACTEMVHTEEVRGADTIEFGCDEEPSKGDRLVWRDVDGTWREHVVATVTRPLKGCFRVRAESSMCELACDYVENKRLQGATAAEAVAGAIAATRWEVDANCQAISMATVWFYHKSVLAALREIERKWNCELYMRVSVDAGRVAHRFVGVKRTLGAKRGARFTYAKNMTACEKTVLSDEVFTALYGWGAGAVVLDDDGYWTGGYTNRLSFADVNNGVSWVGSESAREQFGIWNRDRTAKVHRFGEVVFKDVADPHLLYARTLRELAFYTSPQVSYAVSVQQFEGTEAVELGDTVAVIDTSVDPAWRFTARVLRRVRTFGTRVAVRVELETLKQVTNDASRGVLITRADDVVDDPEIEGGTPEQMTSTAVADVLAQLELGEEEF